MTEDLTPLDHLQRAAIELIAAARSALDLLEEVVSDPPGFAAGLSGRRQAPPPPEKVEHIPIR